MLHAFINGAQSDTPPTRDNIRQWKQPAKQAERDQKNAERHRQGEDQRTALHNVCRQLERERDESAQKYVDLCRSLGKEPEPISPSLVPEGEPPMTVAEDLERAVAILLTARGFDPKADQLKKAIGDLVKAALVQHNDCSAQ